VSHLVRHVTLRNELQQRGISDYACDLQLCRFWDNAVGVSKEGDI
jgi:hypothetical protein